MLRNIASLCLLTICLSPSSSFAAPPEGKGGGKGGEDPPPVEPLYEYISLGSLNGSLSSIDGNILYTRDINNSNDVVGSDTPPDSEGWHAFLCTSDDSDARLPMIDLNDFVDPASNLTLTHAWGINDQGQIVGQGKISGSLVGFRFTPPAGGALTFDTDGQPVFLVDGEVTAPEILTLLPSFGVEAEARDVNSSGNVVGGYIEANGDVGVFIYLEQTQTFVDLGAPAGAIGGSAPYGISDTNLIAGHSDFTLLFDGLRAWQLQYDPATTPTFVDLGVLDPSVSSPQADVRAMNNHGEIVGTSETVISTRTKGKRSTTVEGPHGFLYLAGIMIDIGDISPNGINDHGDIAGNKTDGLYVLFADPDIGLLNVNSVTVLPESLLTLENPLRTPDINDAGFIAGTSGSYTIGMREEAFLLVPLP